MQPMPKQTRHTVLRWLVPAAERTIRKTLTARGPPNDRGRFVTRMKIGPLCFKVCSLAASEADVEDAGYSPPVPKPTIDQSPVKHDPRSGNVLTDNAPSDGHHL